MKENYSSWPQWLIRVLLLPHQTSDIKVSLTNSGLAKAGLSYFLIDLNIQAISEQYKFYATKTYSSPFAKSAQITLAFLFARATLARLLPLV